MFALFVMSKRRTFGNFLASSEDNFFGQKGGRVLQKEAYGNPTYISLNLVEDLQGRPFFFFNSLLLSTVAHCTAESGYGTTRHNNRRQCQFLNNYAYSILFLLRTKSPF